MVSTIDNDIILDIVAGKEFPEDRRVDEQSLRSALDASLRFTRELVDGIIPIVIADDCGEVIRINGLFSEKFGYNGTDVVGKKLEDLFISPRGGDRAIIIGGKEGARELETDIIKKDGTAAQVLLRCMNRQLYKDRFFVVCQIEDITSRKKTEFRLKELSRAVEQSPASVVITDVQGTIEYVNPKFTALTGYSAQEVEGKNPRILKSGEQPKEFYASMWRTLLSGNEWRGEFQNIKKNGELYWEFASISPIRNSRGEIIRFIAVKEDITARKVAESQREAALEALSQSEEILRKKNRIMERELDYAQVIIRMLLPSEAPVFPWVRSCFRYIPLDEIGGDFFSFHPLGDGENLGVFIGDVAGHGVSAALFLSMIKSITDRLHRDRPLGPSEYLQRLNIELIENMQTYFLTAIFGYFHKNRGKPYFVFAKAGHPPPIVWRRKTGEVEIIKSKGSILGYFSEQEFKEMRINLDPGDRIFLYTDGVIETENGEQVMLGQDGFSGMICENAALV